MVGTREVLALSASPAESDNADRDSEQHDETRQGDRKANAPSYLSHDERGDNDEDFEQHCYTKHRAPSALSHASSAASATSERVAAAQGQPA